MGFGANDAAHLFFGVPVMVYGYLIVLDAHGALGKARRLPPSAEYVFMIVFGMVIFVAEIFAYYGCSPNGMMCHDINEMHMLFGVFMMSAGGIGLMHLYVRVFSLGSLWFTPITLCVVGIFMTQHEQSAEYGKFIHTAFGVSAIFSSILRGLTLIDPARWSIFLAWSGGVTAMSFVTGSDSMEAWLKPKMMPHVVILSVCCFNMVLMIPLMWFIYYMTKGQKHYHLKQEKGADTNSEEPLVPHSPRGGYAFGIND